MLERTRRYTIRGRFMAAGEGWKREDVEVTGTFEDAGRKASEVARKLDAEHGDSHFWSVDIYDADDSESGSYYQLFHGRLS